MTSQELIPYAQSSLAERQGYAKLIATAGDMIPRALRDPKGEPILGKVLLVMETGAMLGIHPVAALQGVNVIEGKAALSSGLMSALIRRAGHSLKIETSGTIGGGDLAATVTLTRKDTGDVFTSTWTPKRAHQAGLCAYAEKDGAWKVTARSSSGKALPWEAYTIQLCKARAIGEVYVEGATDLGMGAVYTPEELGSQDEYEDSGQAPAGASAVIEGIVRNATRGWAEEIAAADTIETLKMLWREARAEGSLADLVDGETVESLLKAQAAILKESPGDQVTDEQVASITEWAETLNWNSTITLEHIRKAIRPGINTYLDLTSDEAARVIESMRAIAEEPDEPADEETLI